LDRQADGRVWISSRIKPTKITLDGKPLEWREAGDGIYEFDVSFDRKAALEIRLE
jgi:hypothetical protein